MQLLLAVAHLHQQRLLILQLQLMEQLVVCLQAERCLEQLVHEWLGLIAAVHSPVHSAT